MPSAHSAPATPLLLLADDEPFVLDVLEQIASAAGWNVVTARDGDSLLGLAEAAEHVTAVLMDVRMPGPGVEAVLDVLRARHPDARLLLMTGDSFASVPDAADAILYKPFGAAAMRAVLRYRPLVEAAG